MLGFQIFINPPIAESNQFSYNYLINATDLSTNTSNTFSGNFITNGSVTNVTFFANGGNSSSSSVSSVSAVAFNNLTACYQSVNQSTTPTPTSTTSPTSTTPTSATNTVPLTPSVSTPTPTQSSYAEHTLNNKFSLVSLMCLIVMLLLIVC